MSEKSTGSLPSDVRAYLSRLPVLTDRVLVQLVQGIEVNRDLLRYQQRQGFINRLLGEITGHDPRRRLQREMNLLEGQATLLQWVVELSEAYPVSIVALQEIKALLLETRRSVRRHWTDLGRLEAAVIELEEHLESVADELRARCAMLEGRLREVELGARAHQDLDGRVSAWENGTYSGLPWAVQVALLAREVFSGPVAVYEMESSDPDRRRFRNLLADTLVARSGLSRGRPLVFAGLLDETVGCLAGDDLEMSTAILDVRFKAFQHVRRQPYLFTLGTALELAALPPAARPVSPGTSAWALCRRAIDDIERLVSPRDLAKSIVDETADECVTILEGAADL